MRTTIIYYTPTVPNEQDGDGVKYAYHPQSQGAFQGGVYIELILLNQGN